jgi:hypothetical protein
MAWRIGAEGDGELLLRERFEELFVVLLRHAARSRTFDGHEMSDVSSRDEQRYRSLPPASQVWMFRPPEPVGHW